MKRKKSILFIIAAIIWMIVMLVLDDTKYQITDSEAIKESLKWGLP